MTSGVGASTGVSTRTQLHCWGGVSLCCQGDVSAGVVVLIDLYYSGR